MTRLAMTAAAVCALLGCSEKRAEPTEPPAPPVKKDPPKSGLGVPAVPGADHSQATVTFGKIKIEGTLDSASFERILALQKQRLTFCYRLLLRTDPGVHGLASLTFTVEPDGRVSRVRAVGVANPKFAQCAHSAVLSIRFPPGAKQKSTVEVPIDLSLGPALDQGAPPLTPAEKSAP